MDDPAFAIDLDITAQSILLHASNHDLAALKPFLRVPGNANVQDPETGFTPLHAAIAACGPATSNNTASIVGTDSDARELGSEITAGGVRHEGPAGNVAEEEEEEVDMEAAKAVVKELFLSGAIWNDIDNVGETPGCLAWRLGRQELYGLVVEAGVRAEMLMNMMGAYEQLEDEGDEDEEEDQDGENCSGEVEDGLQIEDSSDAVNGQENGSGEEKELEVRKDVNSEDYLKSELKFDDEKLLDADSNGVMMAWETDIMQQSVDLLLPPEKRHGAKILNIGFGMGIIDRMFAETKPQSHHIIEAHPAVLSKIKEEGSEFGQKWEESAPERGKYMVHAGRWQDVAQTLLEKGETFDVIYFDTFGEDYSQLQKFFTDYVVGLLEPDGRFGFFNGLGADRRVCHDVYCKVAELDLCEAGFDVEWHDVDVKELGGEHEGEWKGVKRRYWTLDKYRLPICTFMG